MKISTLFSLAAVACLLLFSALLSTYDATIIHAVVVMGKGLLTIISGLAIVFFSIGAIVNKLAKR